MALYDIIIEKNLFSPDRKKWVSEPSAGKQGDAQTAKKQLDDLLLMGTIVSGQSRYAVLRTKKAKSPQQEFHPYTKGDYVQGYLLKEIDEKKVTLLDESENLEYVVFINDDTKVRLAEKTEVKAQPSKPPVEPVKPDRASKKRQPKKPPSSPASPPETPDAAKKALEKRAEQESRPERMPLPEIPDNIRQALEQEEEQEEP